MLYLDTAALVKLVRREPETDALVDWLAARASTPWVTSVLAEVELARALRRTEPDLVSAVPALLARLRARVADRVVLVSVGGIETGDEAYARIAAGASLVQSYTGFVYGGPTWAARVNRELAAALRAHGHPSVTAAVGSAA